MSSGCFYFLQLENWTFANGIRWNHPDHPDGRTFEIIANGIHNSGFWWPSWISLSLLCVIYCGRIFGDDFFPPLIFYVDSGEELWIVVQVFEMKFYLLFLVRQFSSRVSVKTSCGQERAMMFCPSTTSTLLPFIYFHVVSHQSQSHITEWKWFSHRRRRWLLSWRVWIVCKRVCRRRWCKFYDLWLWRESSLETMEIFRNFFLWRWRDFRSKWKPNLKSNDKTHQKSTLLAADSSSPDDTSSSGLCKLCKGKKYYVIFGDSNFLHTEQWIQSNLHRLPTLLTCQNSPHRLHCNFFCCDSKCVAYSRSSHSHNRAQLAYSPHLHH